METFEETEGSFAVGEVKQIAVEAADPVPEISAIESPNGYGQVVVVKDGYEVKRLDGRDEGKRSHTFDDLATFAAYLNRHGNADTVELLLSGDCAVAALDPKGSDPERITCDLYKHPTFEAWEEVLDKPMPQKVFHQLARAFRGSVENSEGLLAALRVVSVARKGEMKSEIDETGATRLNLVTDSREMAGTLPPEFIVLTPVYRGILAEDGAEITYPIEMLLSIDIDEMAFTLNAPALALVTYRARQDVAAMLNRELNEGFLVGLGSLAIHARQVLEPTLGTAKSAE